MGLGELGWCVCGGARATQRGRDASSAVRMGADGARVSRREVLGRAAGAAAAAGWMVATNARGAARAAMYDDKKVNVAPGVAPGSALAKYLPQIDAGLDTLLELQREWAAKTEALDGDVVRRYLGTVGVKSPLFGVRKAFEGAWRALADIPSTPDDTLEEVNETYNKVLDGISAIDFQLYSVNFTELRPTKEKLIDQGKAALDSTIDLYRGLVATLHEADVTK